MTPLNKHHIYSLFLEEENNDSLIFKNPKNYSIVLCAVITIMFFSVYFIFVKDMPDENTDKIYLQYFTLGLGSISAIMLLNFATSSQTLTIRKPLDTITYEYRTLSSVKGWKRKISEFDKVNLYTTTKTDSGGLYNNNCEHWIFEIVTLDEDLKVSIFPSLVHIPAKNNKKALEFSKKISDFMNIKINME